MDGGGDDDAEADRSAGGEGGDGAILLLVDLLPELSGGQQVEDDEAEDEDDDPQPGIEEGIEQQRQSGDHLRLLFVGGTVEAGRPPGAPAVGERRISIDAGHAEQADHGEAPEGVEEGAAAHQSSSPLEVNSLAIPVGSQSLSACRARSK